MNLHVLAAGIDLRHILQPQLQLFQIRQGIAAGGARLRGRSQAGQDDDHQRKQDKQQPFHGVSSF